MDILDDMGVSKLSAKFFLKVNYSFKAYLKSPNRHINYIKNLIFSTGGSENETLSLDTSTTKDMRRTVTSVLKKSLFCYHTCVQKKLKLLQALVLQGHQKTLRQ